MHLLQRRLLGDLPRIDQLGQVLVHGVHALLASRLHRRRDLIGLALTDEVRDGRSHDENLGRHRTTLAARPLHEGLADDTLQGGRELGPHLPLLVRREDIDDAVDGLRGILGVQRGEHQMPGLCCSERNRNGLQVAQLTDQDHIGVLPQHVPERVGEAVGVRADLALIHERHLVAVQELDRVLDRHDVVGAGAVDQVDERGQGGRLARAGRTSYQHEAPGQGGEAGDRIRNPQLIELLDLGGDEPERRADRATLLVEVHAETRVHRNRVCEVELELLLEGLLLRRGEDTEQRIRHPLTVPYDIVGDRAQRTVHPDHRDGVVGDVQVGCPAENHFLQCGEKVRVGIDQRALVARTRHRTHLGDLRRCGERIDVGSRAKRRRLRLGENRGEHGGIRHRSRHVDGLLGRVRE